MKTICQECGKELTSWGELHTYQMCGNYHLQRAEEILGFSLRNMEIWKTELEKCKHNWILEALKIEKALELIKEAPKLQAPAKIEDVFIYSEFLEKLKYILITSSTTTGNKEDK